MKVYAVIPARSGSKSIVNKNIRLIAGKPMISYSISHAIESRYINRIIVSTDSPEYAEIAKQYGAEVPFLRPAEFAADTSTDFDVFFHALNYLKTHEDYIPDLVVQLRPTYPIRNPKDIDRMIEIMIERPELDSLRCIAPAKEIPHKMWYQDSSGRITPILNDIKEAYNLPRQQLPKVYYQNACIDVIRSTTIMEKNSMSGDIIGGYEMDHNYDIDTEEEFQAAQMYLQITSGGKRFVFDIDGVIAEYREDLSYASAGPNRRMIDIINRIYDYGNEIILFTARGYVTGIDWRETTAAQMKEWGVKYHELHFGKPNADYYIDDKMLSLQSLYSMLT